MTNTRQKGKILERYVAEQIKEKGLDDRAYARGDSGGGNKEKTDITTSLKILEQNAGIECKNAANANVKQWWQQTKKLESLGYEPMLVYSLKNEPLEDSKVVVYLDTLLELLKYQNEEITTNFKMTWQSRRKLETLKRAIGDVMNDSDLKSLST